jgi:hypothetical protein
MPEATIEAALFEGMFVRAMRPDPSFTTELRELGFDVRGSSPAIR